MEIRRYVSDLVASNMYLIVEGDSAIVIDPCRDTEPANGLKIDRILLTHEHYDHISGVNLWKKKTGAPVLCSKACAQNIGNPRKNFAGMFELFSELQTWVVLDRPLEVDETYGCSAEETFDDETVLTWKGHRVKLFEIPGHSMGSIGILLDEEAFFSGDSLLEGCEIALRLPGGSRAKWEQIGAHRIAEVPDGVRVYPGHLESFVYRKEKGEV